MINKQSGFMVRQLNTRYKPILLGLLALWLVSCGGSDNEHFCVKYEYFYTELTKPGVLPFPQLERQLKAEVKKGGADSERSNMALFVLGDVQKHLKRPNESPKDYCMRRERWLRYQ